MSANIIKIEGVDGKLEIKTNFKNKLLQQSTEELTGIYNQAFLFVEDKNRQIAKILGNVAAQKAYKDDGFASVAEYAEQTFGMKKAKAYEYARAGLVYNDPKSHPELKKMTPSNISAVNSIPEAQLKKDLDAGKISADSSQKQLREYAQTAKNTTSTGAMKSTVVTMYTAHPIPMLYEPNDDSVEWTELQKPRTIEEWDDVMVQQLRGDTEDNVEIIELPKAKLTAGAKKGTLLRKLYIGKTDSTVVEYPTYVESVKKDENSSYGRLRPGMSKEDMMKVLVEMSADELEEIKAIMTMRYKNSAKADSE